MPETKTPTVANVFSPRVRDALIRASLTPAPMDRIKAVERAHQLAKETHPDLFKKEKYHED